MMDNADKEFGFQLFGLSAASSLAELKKKYRELIKKYHPDKHPEKIEWSTRMVQQLNEAYKVLLLYLKRINNFELRQEENNSQPRTTRESYKDLILSGDEAVRDAIVIGWIKRNPKDDFAKGLKLRIEDVLRKLTLLTLNETQNHEIDFFTEFFSVFLEATMEKVPRPLPSIENPTVFLRHLSSANKYLDTGIRNYYHFREAGSLKNLYNIPLSFLEDSIRLYKSLGIGLTDRPTIRLIGARIKLATLFKTRVKDSQCVTI
jgi:curved DNA-binding protein CbpA